MHLAENLSFKRYQSLHSDAGSSLSFRWNDHCSFKFFLVGGSTPNKLGHVVAYNDGRICTYINCFSSGVVLVALDRLLRV